MLYEVITPSLLPVADVADLLLQEEAPGFQNFLFHQVYKVPDVGGTGPAGIENDVSMVRGDQSAPQGRPLQSRLIDDLSRGGSEGPVVLA